MVCGHKEKKEDWPVIWLANASRRRVGTQPKTRASYTVNDCTQALRAVTRPRERNLLFFIFLPTHCWPVASDCVTQCGEEIKENRSASRKVSDRPITVKD